MGLFGNKPQREQPLYTSNYMGFRIHIYPNRIEFGLGSGHQSIPLGQLASVQLGRALFMQITLETTGGQKYTIPTNHKKEVQRAIYDAQSRFLNPRSAPSIPSTSVADEIAKLHDLKQRGIITEADFEKRKNQLLG
jgi:Short C-terminal domain